MLSKERPRLPPISTAPATGPPVDTAAAGSTGMCPGRMCGQQGPDVWSAGAGLCGAIWRLLASLTLESLFHAPKDCSPRERSRAAQRWPWPPGGITAGSAARLSDRRKRQGRQSRCVVHTRAPNQLSSISCSTACPSPRWRPATVRRTRQPAVSRSGSCLRAPPANSAQIRA